MKPEAQVLVVVPSTAIGGHERNAIELADSVRSHGFDTRLLVWRRSTDRDTSVLPYAQERQLPVTVRDLPIGTRAVAADMARVAAGQHASIIHTYSWWLSRAALWGPGVLGRLPVVATNWEMWTHPSIPSGIPLIVGTEYQFRALGARRGATHLLHPPVDMAYDNPELFPAGAPPDEAMTLVIVSRLATATKAAGILASIRALQYLPPSTSLRIVGSGAAEEAIRAEAARVNADLGRPAIEVVGAREDAREWYARADVVLGMGGSAARALAFGKPLVVLGKYGAPELFTPEAANDVYGRSFYNELRIPEPAQAIAETARGLGSVDLRQTLGSFGRTFAEDRFALRLIADELAEVYRQALLAPRRANWLADAARDAAGRASRVPLALTRRR